MDPKGAQLLISQGDVDVIDVREVNEFGTGHVPTARNVPLGELKANPRAVLTGARVLLVCAKGMRSATAAQIAEELGLAGVFHLEGGTLAWDAAGLPLEHPTKPERLPRPPRDPSAEETLELGTDELPAHQARPATSVLRKHEARRSVSSDGKFSSRALHAAAEKPHTEFDELWLAARGREDAPLCAPGTRKNLIVASGKLELQVGEHKYELERGDAIAFAADVAHAYVNPGDDECWMYLVTTR